MTEHCPPAATPRGACCTHLLTAHTVPDGLCTLCPCTGWTARADEPEETS